MTDVVSVAPLVAVVIANIYAWSTAALLAIFVLMVMTGQLLPRAVVRRRLAAIDNPATSPPRERSLPAPLVAWWAGAWLLTGLVVPGKQYVNPDYRDPTLTPVDVEPAPQVHVHVPEQSAPIGYVTISAERHYVCDQCGSFRSTSGEPNGIEGWHTCTVAGSNVDFRRVTREEHDAFLSGGWTPTQQSAARPNPGYAGYTPQARPGVAAVAARLRRLKRGA